MRLVFRIQKKPRRARRNSRRDTGRRSVLETRSGMASANINLKESGIPQLQKWCSNSRKQGHPVFTSPCTFNADASNTELFFRIILQPSSVFTEQCRVGVSNSVR